jgi:two-component system phosphate regulon sensor histidine kinase PhoR
MQALMGLLRRLPWPRVETSRSMAMLQATVVVVALVGAAAVGWAFVRAERLRLASTLTERGEWMTALMAQGLVQPVGASDLLAARDLLNPVRDGSVLRGARVADLSGNVLAEAGTPPEGESLEATTVTEKAGFRHRVFVSSETGEKMHEFRRSIDDDKQSLGTVTVWFAMPGTWASLWEGLGYSRLPIAILAVVLFVGNYLVALLMRPIQQLRDRSRAASEGERWQSLNLGGVGEAAEIARSWDAMVAKFEATYEKLAAAHRDMEVSSKIILFEKRRTESIIDALSQGVIVLDAYGKICLINREGEAMLKLERNVLVGQPASLIASPPELAVFIADTQNGLNRHARRTTELTFPMPEGPNRVVKVVTTPLQDGTDTAAGTLVVLGDITQQKMEQQAREDFISSVSHELRAPLAAIKGYVEMLLDDEANSPELRREFFNTMNEECDRLARLVDNMINISRIEIGGLVLNRSLVKTRKLLRDAVSAVAAQAKSKNITLQARIPDDLPDMDADKEMFRVAVMNLLGNALKYTSPGGSVALSGERVGDELRVHVVDTGWGISEEEQQKIFQKFYRGKEATDRKVTGNGLGLALTKEIATLHGGDVKLESKLGEGSKFTLVLPVR